MTSISAASLLPIARLTWRERLSARHEHPFRAHSHASRAPRRRVGLLTGRTVALPERRVNRRAEARIRNSAKRQAAYQVGVVVREGLDAPVSRADSAGHVFAATALEHNLTLVTRNVKDFAGLGVSLLNPWDAA